MGMIRYRVDGRYEVQCPTCRQSVLVTRVHFDGIEPLPRHSRWTRSIVQDSYHGWPRLFQRRWTLRLLLRIEIAIRTLNRFGEPACEDVTPRLYREWLPEGCGQLGPSA